MVSILCFGFPSREMSNNNPEKKRELERVGIFFGKTVLSTLYPIKNSKSEGGIPLNVWFIA